MYISWSVENNHYYIGITSKVGKELENYFGSSKHLDLWPDKRKLVVFKTERKTEVKLMELILQLDVRWDERNLNDSYNVRLNKRHAKGLTDDIVEKVRKKTSRVLEMRLK